MHREEDPSFFFSLSFRLPYNVPLSLRIAENVRDFPGDC